MLLLSKEQNVWQNVHYWELMDDVYNKTVVGTYESAESIKAGFCSVGFQRRKQSNTWDQINTASNVW